MDGYIYIVVMMMSGGWRVKFERGRFVGQFQV